MDYDEKNTEELEAELYSRIHHDKPETIDTVAAVSLPPPIQNRTVSRHSVVNNNKMNKKAVSSKNRKKAVERCNPNPFAFASAVNNHIPKRFTPYTSYLSQVDSQPITSLPNVQSNDNNETEIVQKPDERRPNPFNKGFNRTEEKMKRVQQMEAKKARADKVREEVRLRNEDAVNIKQEVQDVVIIETITKPISVPESDSDDEVYIYPPEQPTVISSDEEETNAPAEKEPEPIDNLPDDCDAINVDYDKRLSRHDDPFGGIDVAHLNTLISADPPESLPPAKEATDHFAKPQRANRQALKRSYDVQDTDFAATDVYESESSDLPENIAPKGRKLATVLSESEGSDVDTSKRSKRMRKRRKSGSNRGSDHFSSDDSDDDGEAYLEPGKTTRPYYLHRGEGVFNAVTKYSKRVTNSRSDQQHRDVSLVAMDSSEDSQAEEELDIVNGNWVVTDTVGETDDIELNDIEKLADVDKSIEQNDANVNENNEQNESNVDKDDNNGVGSERLVIHPEMGWNREMRAFYNDSWGGETHNMMAIRKQMPKDSFEWRIDPKDLRANYNVLGIRCHNCRENGHRMASCPQPKKQVICFTCGMAGHREIRCPNAICLRCGRKTHSFRRGCEGCFGVSQITCKKCRRRGHYAQDCPDNWRAYHNTTDPAAPPIPASSIRPKRCCSVCAGYGHRAEQCYDFQLFMQDDAIPVEIRQYEKVYDDPPIDNSMSTPYSMFENPRENFRFVWKVNENRDRVYGRFMEATKIQRDASTPSTKRRKKAKIPKTIEKFVLNPMNAQNIRDKPKKQFAKNFYEESPTKNDADRDVVENETNAPNANVSDELGSENTSGALHESGNADSDVVMKELDPIEPAAAANNSENSDESQIIQRSADDELMQEAIEVDNLRGRSANFSFSKEMDDLEKSRALFDLSFIGSSEHHEPQEINLSPIIPTKARAEKMRKAEEIEQLTEMEISLNKLKDDIVLNVTNASDQSLHCVHDSDSNYSFGEYFNESKSNAKEKEEDRSDTVESPDYIPLPPHIDSSDIAAASDAVDEGISAAKSSVNSAKIFLTKQHARLLLSTESGNKLLHDASNTHNVKVRMDWENLGNVLIVVGTTLNQNKFHADLIRFLVEMCKKMRIKNETFQQVPKSKMALIRFIREQFALLEQPLGNVTELYKNMRRNENLKSKNGTKNADRARKNLNIILMGRAGLREGRLHLAGLESNLKFLLNNNKEMMTKQTREEIYQHYRYVFSPFEHDDYPDLISEYEEMKRSKAFPPLNIDRNLLEIKISVKDDAGDLGRAKQKLMRTNNDNEPQEDNHEPVDEVALIVDTTEPKTSTPKSNVKREPRTPKQHGKSPKADQRTPKQESKAHNGQTEAVESVGAGENSASVNKNAVWSLKCKDIVEQCRQKHIKSSKVVDKLNMVLEKASRNELSYADYKSLEPIVNTLNRTVN